MGLKDSNYQIVYRGETLQNFKTGAVRFLSTIEGVWRRILVGQDS